MNYTEDFSEYAKPDFPPGPYGAKQKLAYEIVKTYHGQAEADHVLAKWNEWVKLRKLRKLKKAPKNIQ